jgi:predicted HTH transcriptional regulator
LNLGAILFAHDLTRFESVRHKALQIVFYRGRGKSAANEELPLGQKGYALILNDLLDALRTRLPRREVSKGAQRISQPDYPESSVRELIVNALVHQDFRVRGSCAMVDIFEDRLEITNPGHPLVDIRRLIDCHPKSRNEQLAELMRFMRLFEGRGSGIDIVIDRGEELGLPPPEFEALGLAGGPLAMRASLLAPKTFSDMSPAERLRGVEQHAANQFSKKLRLTNLSLRERFQLDKDQIAQVSRLIKRAVAENLIKPAEEEGRSYVPYWA